jgi:hypothetical protein
MNLMPAIPIAQLCAGLARLRLSDTDIRSLGTNVELSEILFAADQVRFLDNYCCEVLKTPIASSDLALLFAVHQRTIQCHQTHPVAPGVSTKTMRF